ncbi:MAG: bifunctional non-ous end joining protein LigD [Acidimicrobiaceae bacterium]|nr:bifunctional non-ous end joining protein LigD [Acidimicrobiaceae bacterium]
MTIVDVEGRQLSLSNLDKVLYPKAGFTKGQVIAYYQRIAPALLTHLAGRPLTLKRYPNGVEGHFFYEKRCPSYRPDWMRTAEIWSDSNKGIVNYCVVDDLAALVWVANTASLELHPSLSKCDDMPSPTVVAFDLDPGAPADMVDCARIGLRLRELFEHMGLESFPKTSGSKGLQIYVPINTPTTYEGGTKDFALAVAQLFEKQFPDEVVHQMAKALRPGKVLIDWSQNDEYKTTVSVYSLRARERPTVSTPITWDEVSDVAERGDPDLVRFEADDVVARFEQRGDLFAPVATLQQELPTLTT